MAINTDLLISAPMLQDYFVDKTTGEALSAGIVTCYQDNSRTTLKNWYYQSGAPGNYTFVALENPLTLSASGTITDPSGNDTIPFFYPYSETDNSTKIPYYITVDNSNLQRQFVRENFPFLGTQTPSNNQVPTLKNYIVNNVFWHNIGSFDATNVFAETVAPGAHDGFSGHDIVFFKTAIGAVDTITFTKFPQGESPLTDDITPEYYINHECTSIQVGETFKAYQFPIALHVKTLESVEAAITIQARNVSGSSNFIDINILQFLGTGVISPDSINEQRITLTNSWQKYIIPFTFPSAEDKVLSSTGDDALYLQISLPVGAIFEIDFCLPSLYLDSNVPTNNFTTYDEVDSIINSPRTGDIRTSLNTFSPFGWVAMNDGTIGNPSSGATRANIDTWNLFLLIWTNVGSTNAPMFTSAGAPVAYGSSAYEDWIANRRISLTKQLGRAIASAGLPSSGGSGTTWALGETTGAELHTLTAAENGQHTHTATILVNEITFSSAGASTAFAVGGATPSVSDVSNSTSPASPTAGHNTIQPTVYYNIFMKL